MTKNISGFPSWRLIVALCAACLFLLSGCGTKDASGDKEPATETEEAEKKSDGKEKSAKKEPAKAKEEASAEAALTDDEEAALKDEFAEEVETTITAANAQGELDKLEAELNSDK